VAANRVLALPIQGTVPKWAASAPLQNLYRLDGPNHPARNWPLRGGADL